MPSNHHLQPPISKNTNKRLPAGFTLIEALVALSILIVGIMSGFILITRSLYSAAIIQDRLTASFLAQEGAELVRQIRDSNYLRTLNDNPTNWDQGLADGSYIVAFNPAAPDNIFFQPAEDIQYLKYDAATGLFNYASGEPTSFMRTIKITSSPLSPDKIQVGIEMNWKSKNIDFSFLVEDHLYNWLDL